MTLYLLDGNPDTFVSVASHYHGVDEPLQPDAGVHHHAHELVLPNKDAALGSMVSQRYVTLDSS